MTALPAAPVVSAARRSRLAALAERTARAPRNLAALIRDELKLDLTARYAGLTIPHPFGKASGQLSCTVPQIESDVQDGVAFIVLKTVIAEDADGARTMGDWTVRESRMKVERRTSLSDHEGWTVTWKGRGWPGSLDEYLAFFEQALDVARKPDVPVVPSVKYHLPIVGDAFRIEEYRHTTGRLLELWGRAGCGGDMILEKDFSPTLAGDDRARARETVLRWIAEVPAMVVGSRWSVVGGSTADNRPPTTDARSPTTDTRPPTTGIRLGLKLMNTLFDDEFQVEMTRAATKASFLVVYNRLFDPGLQTAYGGYDLSDRNLRVLDRLRNDLLPPLCGTGNICSGRMMVEYALRGCESGQVHTFFQVPLKEYTATAGGRAARALHTLLLHPTDGLVAWLWHLNETGQLEERDGLIRFLDLVESRAEARARLKDTP